MINNKKTIDNFLKSILKTKNDDKIEKLLSLYEIFHNLHTSMFGKTFYYFPCVENIDDIIYDIMIQISIDIIESITSDDIIFQNLLDFVTDKIVNDNNRIFFDYDREDLMFFVEKNGLDFGSFNSIDNILKFYNEFYL